MKLISRQTSPKSKSALLEARAGMVLCRSLCRNTSSRFLNLLAVPQDVDLTDHHLKSSECAMTRKCLSGIDACLTSSINTMDDLLNTSNCSTPSKTTGSPDLTPWQQHLPSTNLSIVPMADARNYFADTSTPPATIASLWESIRSHVYEFGLEHHHFVGALFS